MGYGKARGAGRALGSWVLLHTCLHSARARARACARLFSNSIVQGPLQLCVHLHSSFQLLGGAQRLCLQGRASSFSFRREAAAPFWGEEVVCRGNASLGSASVPFGLALTPRLAGNFQTAPSSLCFPEGAVSADNTYGRVYLGERGSLL